MLFHGEAAPAGVNKCLRAPILRVKIWAGLRKKEKVMQPCVLDFLHGHRVSQISTGLYHTVAVTNKVTSCWATEALDLRERLASGDIVKGRAEDKVGGASRARAPST
ncbi:hypothetical protein QYE76_050467 [Lolium multiflorum]|uniref:Uncharacterized protein n=1 Tax=Lolium multiflorum TaxID=4521 RepID=A0AAD8SPZ7_LOLMU|nr:hypothetical protein QYE76_050467 [Lolium multiflorum]